MPRDVGRPGITVLDPAGVLPRLKAGEPIKLLRQSNVGSADICLKRAGFDMRPNNPRHSGEARCVGTSYHGGLEVLYRARLNDAFWETMKFPEVEAGAREAFEAEAALFDDWVTSKEASWQRVVTLLRTYLGLDGGSSYAWGADCEILGVEQEWFLPLSGDWYLKGTIDLVLRDHDGRLRLADHKTAGRKWDQKKHLPGKQTQAVLYAWAWWRLTGEMPAAFHFDVMTYKGEFDRRECVVEPRHVQAVLEKTIGVARIMDAVPLEWLPGNPSSNLCSAIYCDYWAECPMGFATQVDVSPSLALSHSAVGSTTPEAQ